MYTLPEKRNPLERSGINRLERLNEALESGFVQIEERHENDFLQHAFRLAGQIQYYDGDNQRLGDWSDFFQPGTGSEKPHKALFLAFLQLLELLHEHTNGLTDRHLDYYYGEVLQFVEKQADPTRVHLFFECAQTLKYRFLGEGLALNAGKNENGKDILFRLTDELVVNQSRVVSAYSVFREVEDFGYRLFTANNSAALQGGADENADGFSAFGESQVVHVKNGTTYTPEIAPEEHRSMDDAEIGFALASPLFRMEEGERKITVKLYSRIGKLPLADKSIFQFHLSTEDGWFNLPGDQVMMRHNLSGGSVGSLNSISLELSLSPQDPALSNHNLEVHGGDFRTLYPVLKVVFAPENAPYGFAEWQDFHFEKIGVSAHAKGVRSLIFQNDRSLLDPARPFRPFGPVPSQGDNFYVGHPEILRHKLTDLRLKLEWKDVPAEQLGQYYATYTGTNPSLSNDDFQVRIDVLDEKNWHLHSSGESLFDMSSAQSSHEIALNWAYPNDFKRKRKEETAPEWTHAVRDGFIRMRLAGPTRSDFRAFGHTNYPQIVMSRGTAIGIPQPYSPMLAAVELTYTTEELIVTPLEPETIYQVGPLGMSPNRTTAPGDGVRLLPEFDQEACFYLGIEGLNPPQTLSLLFQMGEGSGNADESKVNTEVTWSYLCGNEWKSLSQLRIGKDTTRNLLHSGLIHFDLPSDIDHDHQTMPRDQYWIRASIPGQSSGIDRILSVHAQGAEAIGESGTTTALEPGRISKVSGGAKGIDSVSQPYASFEGNPAEDRRSMLVRAHERLRHKDRAVMIQDYERLVLQEFSGIWKVKCLNHTDLKTEQSAGKVMVALVPDLRMHQARNPFQPKVGLYRRMEVHEFIKARISPFIDLRIENPVYEPLRLSFNVGFHEGYDEGYYGQLLHQEIQEFLSPWAFDATKDLVFGGQIHKSTVLKFIEDRPYVDFVNDFTMYHTYPDPTAVDDYDNLTPLQEGACHVFRFVVNSIHEPYISTLIKVKVRLLNGLISDDVVAKFVEELEFMLKKKDEKGVAITRSLVNSMVKSIYYVDRIVDISCIIPLPEDLVMKDVDVAESKTGRSIMTSSIQHRIGVYRAGDYHCEGNIMIGIGFMIVEADFIVT